MSRTAVLAEFYNKLPDIQQHINLIVYIKTDTNNENYNSNYARELIGTNIRIFFQRTTLLQQFSTSDISQPDLLFDFSQWVHMIVDEEIKKKGTSTNNYVINTVPSNNTHVINNDNVSDERYFNKNSDMIANDNSNNRLQIPGVVDTAINTVLDDSTDLTSASDAITTNTSFSRRGKYSFEIEQYRI